MAISFVVVLCALVIGCSSSDNGRVSELEDQLDVAEAARMTAENQLAELRTQIEALMGRAEISPEALAELRTQVETLAGRADISPEDLVDLRGQLEAAAQNMADAQFDAALANAVERVTLWDRGFEISPDNGPPHSTSGVRHDARAYSDSGSEFAAVSQTHEGGDRINAAVPWHDEDGGLQFYVSSAPVQSSLHDEGVVYTGNDLWTNGPDREGVTTAYEPIRSHGLGEEWQGFDLMKAYGSDGARKIRLFSDFGESDVLAQPYDYEVPDFDDYGRQILLSDERVPDNPSGPPRRDWLYIIIPEDGLQGSLDGAAGTFSCAGVYCTLTTSADSSGYTPWIDSQAIRFTPADGSAEVMLDSPHVVRPSTELPKANYLAFGSWEYLPEDVTDIEAYDFGVFAGGDDPFMATDLPVLVGTASYAGKAAGTYAETIHPQTESFVADVGLTADFGSEGELGRVTGMVSNFQLESGSPMSVSSLRLETMWDWENELWAPNVRVQWDGNEDFIPGGLIEGETVADGGWKGLWSGKFFGNGAAGPASHPTSVAGTFGATDGTRSIAGAFGAHKQ